MCANFDQSRNDNAARQLMLELDPTVLDWKNRPSIYPKYEASIIQAGVNRPMLTQAKWSIVPAMEPDPEAFLKKYDTFNAKSESIQTSRLYSGAWRKGQRCIVPATSFIEFRGPKGNKEKLNFKMPNQDFTFLAGLYDESPVFGKNFTILTCAPTEDFKEFHHRMPVIIQDWEKWISKSLSSDEALAMCHGTEGLTYSIATKKVV